MKTIINIIAKSLLTAAIALSIGAAAVQPSSAATNPVAQNGPVFDGQESFARHARAEIGDTANSIIGYYNLKTNRMTMYDLTGVEAAGLTNDRNAAARINGHPRGHY